jgi:hypothetical protein
MRQQRLQTGRRIEMRSQNSKEDQLAQLFREAGSAHHKAFLSTNGDDPEWPLWYAEFLLTRLNAFLGSNLTKSELVYHLIKVEKDRAKENTGIDWPEYYSGYFGALLPGIKPWFVRNIAP